MKWLLKLITLGYRTHLSRREGGREGEREGGREGGREGDTHLSPYRRGGRESYHTHLSPSRRSKLSCAVLLTLRPLTSAGGPFERGNVFTLRRGSLGMTLMMGSSGILIEHL